jgi:hypothetical protein
MVTQAQFDDAYNNAKNLANASQNDMLEVRKSPVSCLPLIAACFTLRTMECSNITDIMSPAAIRILQDRKGRGHLKGCEAGHV